MNEMISKKSNNEQKTKSLLSKVFCNLFTFIKGTFR